MVTVPLDLFYCTWIWLSKILTGHEFGSQISLNIVNEVIEVDDLDEGNMWNSPFGGRRPLVEDYLRWTTTFGGRRPLVEDDLRLKVTGYLQRKTPCNVRQPLLMKNILWSIKNNNNPNNLDLLFCNQTKIWRWRTNFCIKVNNTIIISPVELFAATFSHNQPLVKTERELPLNNTDNTLLWCTSSLEYISHSLQTNSCPHNSNM